MPNTQTGFVNSWYKACFKIPSDSAFAWLKRKEINFAYINTLQPVAVLPDSVSTDSAKLGNGQYIWTNSTYDKVEAYWQQVSQLSTTIYDDGLQTVLLLYNGAGNAVEDAQVSIAEKIAKFSTEAHAYITQQKKWKADETYWVKIAVANDTFFCTTEKKDDRYYYQRYNNKNKWKRLPIIKQVLGISKFISRLFNGKLQYFRNRKLQVKQRETGFVLFNKPIYKPGDTVRLKAWITDRKQRPVSATQSLWISYNANGTSNSFELAKLEAITAGSYIHSFALPDSFPSDTYYNLDFRGPKRFNNLHSNFKIEEYQLPDISKFDFDTDHKEELLAKDTLGLSFDATGTNGLPLLDASVDLIVLAGNVSHFYKDSLFIKDTLFTKNYPLQTDGKTNIKLAANIFPQADMELHFVAVLKNSSNETTTKTGNVKLYQHLRKIAFVEEQPFLRITYMENGESIAHKAMLHITGEMLGTDTLIQLPNSFMMPPLAQAYSIHVYDNLGKTLLYDEYDMEENTDKPFVVADSKGDSIGFISTNPSGLLLNYTLTKGRETIWQQQDSSKQFSWYRKMDAKNMYHLHINYLWHGKPIHKEIRLAVYFKRLNIQIEQQPVVQPGGKDTLQITVTDYKKQPVANTNITASGQNTQLKKHFNLPNLPFNMQFKDKHNRPNQNVSFTMYEPNLRDDTAAVIFNNLYKNIGLDSMHFYQRLSSTQPMLLERFVISHVLPELHVSAMSHGRVEQVFITYINNNAVHCAWQDESQVHSTEIYPGYIKVGIRTHNKFMEIDSVYMQPFYKHELLVNLDSVSKIPYVKITDMPDTLLPSEKRLLEQNFIRLEASDVHNNVWLWQGSTAIKLQHNNMPKLVGPFNGWDSINAYKENVYRFKFPFEAGYSYRITKNLVRMEKTGLLAGTVQLTKTNAKWRIGDTIPSLEMPPPATIMPATHPWYFLQTNNYAYDTKRGNGTVQLQIISDSLFAYTILLPADTTQKAMVYKSNPLVLHDVPLGNYRLFLVNNKYEVYTQSNIIVRLNGLNCYEVRPKVFSETSGEIDSLLQLQNIPFTKLLNNPIILNIKEPEEVDVPIQYGKANIKGKIYDKAGNSAIPFASVVLKSLKKGVSTDRDGNFVFKNLAPGNYSIVASAAGYASKEIKVTAVENEIIVANMALEVSQQSLDAVVIVGYGTARKMNLTGSVSIINAMSIDQTLQGRLAGVNIIEGNNVNLRGTGNINEGRNGPLIVVDGVVMDEIPAGLDTSILKVDILKNTTATSLYGARAMNGVIIISTGRNNGPVIRTKFKDDAYWVPNMVTNKNGSVSIPIQYPENITNWQNIIYAAAKKGRYGRALSITKAFKAVQGLLTVPPFLIVGDSVQLVGKAMNFSADPQQLQTHFTMNGQQQEAAAALLPGSSSAFTFGIKAPLQPDTLKPSFLVNDAKSNADGEERTIPVFEKGTKENDGKFFVLDGDTTIRFQSIHTDLPIHFYAENRLIDVLEKELENLKNYAQSCMEQTANKLWGLIMMQQIKKAEAKPFIYQKLLNSLVERLLKNQELQGGWGWWPGSNYNLHITTKVLQALRHLAPTATVNQAIRNAYIYLQNQLDNNNIHNKLEILSTLAEGQHVYPYQFALDTIEFDSLSIHQQWQWVRIKQKAGLAYNLELTKLLGKKQQTITGSVYWGKETWQWYSNQHATTVLAYRVLEQDSLQQYLPYLKQFFLEQKRNGYYRNTVEQAEITALLLTSALKQGSDTSATTLSVGNQIITNFPAKGTINISQAINIRKSGKGLVYLGLSQQWQNTAPQKVDSLFDVRSYFVDRNTDTIKHSPFRLPLATAVTLQVKVVVKKDAPFVQIEIPIPAGLVYAAKPQTNYWEHQEYLKDRVLIFKEQMPAGEYTFSIPLESRFAGSFTLNPAKVELMYFPVLFGSDGMKEVEVK